MHIHTGKSHVASVETVGGELENNVGSTHHNMNLLNHIYFNCADSQVYRISQVSKTGNNIMLYDSFFYSDIFLVVLCGRFSSFDNTGQKRESERALLSRVVLLLVCRWYFY